MASRHIGDYLIERLRKLGVRHVFGVPGDYVLGFYDTLQKSPCKLSILAMNRARALPPMPTPACTAWAWSASPIASAA